VDSGAAWAGYALGNCTACVRSFAVSDGGVFGRLSWGVSDYATQGSLIAHKMLAFGPPALAAEVRVWLQAAVVNPDGKAWGTQNGEWHMGIQGTLEANAELTLMARHYAAHTGDASPFVRGAERLVCAADGGGTLRLLGVEHVAGLNDSACAVPPWALTEPSQPWMGAAAALWWDAAAPAGIKTTGNATVHFPVLSHGKGLAQAVSLPFPTPALLLPLQARGAGSQPALVAAVYASSNATGTWALVSSVTLPATPVGQWAALPPPSGAAWSPARYLLHVYIDPAAAQPSPAAEMGWVTDGLAQADGAGAFVAFPPTAPPDRTPGSPPPPGVSPMRVADTLATAMSWQLAAAWSNDSEAGGWDVMVFRQAMFCGAAEGAVNSGCSYYDQYRMGFATGYMNLLFLHSLLAYRELQAAGLLSATCASPWRPGGSAPGTCIDVATVDAAIGGVRNAIGLRFGDPVSGRWVSWYGCSLACVDPRTNATTCSMANVTAAAARQEQVRERGGGGEWQVAMQSRRRILRVPTTARRHARPRATRSRTGSTTCPPPRWL
jgi:hypothetical protein